MNLTLSDHLRDFRKTIVSILVINLTVFLIYYIFLKEKLLNILIKPLTGLYDNVAYLSVIEPITTDLNVSLIFSIVTTFPITLYIIWKFIEPAFDIKAKKNIVFYGILALILFYIGLLFSYFIAIPIIISFFKTTVNEKLGSVLRISEYISLLTRLVLVFSLLFIIPLIIKILVRLNVVTIDKLKKVRKFVFLLAFVLGALITPPDVISQVIVAIPVYVLYEIGILISIK